jgi:hypothetical protein
MINELMCGSENEGSIPSNEILNFILHYYNIIT